MEKKKKKKRKIKYHFFSYFQIPHEFAITLLKVHFEEGDGGSNQEHLLKKLVVVTVHSFGLRFS